MHNLPKVMISSTALDLPDHREAVRAACLEQGMFPVMMEHLAAGDDAISASLKMVDDADIYLLVLAHRYGNVPTKNNPQAISITEMEYNRALDRDRNIQRAVFIADEAQPLSDFKIDDIETGKNADKLKNLKERCKSKNVVKFFRSPADLRAHVINSLSKHPRFVSGIPKSPHVYIAHQYTLLQTRTRRLIGRRNELKRLTDWITGKELEADIHESPADSVRILSLVAIGGTGKSALTWKWFNEIAPQEMKNVAGRMWWSFYESDATFENFMTHALAYVTNCPLGDVQRLPLQDRERQLLGALNDEPFLLVLDGLERILVAYAGMDASRLDDSDVGKEKNLRKTIDPRTGNFLKKLAQSEKSRILVSTRLFPTELERDDGHPIPGAFRLKMKGLSDEDAVELWRVFNVSGSRTELVPLFNAFDKHPLLIQALAGVVSSYRKAPGNFAAWRKANPQFDPSRFEETREATVHVLEFALRGLYEKAAQTLSMIAGFRMPASYDALFALLVGESKACLSEHELAAVLKGLEDRGLIGWDKGANRYDLHPIVRWVAWSRLSEDKRQKVWTSLLDYLETVPLPDDYRKAHSLADISLVIERYYIQTELKKYDDAALLFLKHLEKVVFYRVTVNQQIVDLLRRLFHDPEKPGVPVLNDVKSQIGILIAMADAYAFTGSEKDAKRHYLQSIELCSESHDEFLAQNFQGLALTLARSGKLHSAEVAARRALVIARRLETPFWEARSSRKLGLVLASRGRIIDALRILNRTKIAFDELEDPHWIGATRNYIARCKLWQGEYETAMKAAREAHSLVREEFCEPCSLSSKRLEGLCALAMNRVEAAEECLIHVLENARLVRLPRETIETLQALAQVQLQKGDLRSARNSLNDIWTTAKSGPYPLVHADALNVLAQIERDEGNTPAAIVAATQAYQLAWCDGPPFAYHWGLEKAKNHLKELVAPVPEMPQFDESTFEPMPEVEIDPEDKFHVGEVFDF